MKKRPAITVFVLVLFANLNLVAQIKPSVNEANGASCELNSRDLDIINSQLAGDGTSKLFVEAYAGAGERIRVNPKRIDYVREVLVKWKGFDRDRMTFAAMASAEGKAAHLDFYIVQNSGEKQLWLIMFAKKNATPCMDCCDDGFAPKKLRY